MTESKRPTNSPQQCPACQRLKPGFKGAAGAGSSFSRYADIYICSDCGMTEAATGFFWRDRCPADRIKPHHRNIEIVIGVEQEPRVQFTIELKEGEKLPDLIRLPDGSLIVQRGRYLSPGDRYSYSRVAPPVDFNGPLKEWPEHTVLKG